VIYGAKQLPWVLERQSRDNINIIATLPLQNSDKPTPHLTQSTTKGSGIINPIMPVLILSRLWRSKLQWAAKRCPGWCLCYGLSVGKCKPQCL